MKILLVVRCYEPAWAYGDPPRLVFELARQLAQHSHDVTVCTTDALDATSGSLSGGNTPTVSSSNGSQTSAIGWLST